MSRVIVTGGAGRLGRSVVDRLRLAGHEVASLDRVALDESSLVADLLDPIAATTAMTAFRPEAVVHLAAIAVPFSAPERTIFETNTRLAYATIEASLAAGATRFIAASSPTVLGYGIPGWKPEALPLDEQTTPKPWNAYALSKHVIELTVQAAARQAEGHASFATFRPCYVISPEEWAGAPTQQGHTVADRLADPALAAPSLFNYVDARDAGDFVGVLLEALPQLPPAQNFFVGAADALATRPLAELLPQYFPTLAHLAEDLTGTLPAFSTEKAERLLGWRPQRDWRSETSQLRMEATA
jgi:UDP-glucose 4-epimerase